ncbi:embryonic testis differentiation protein homolog B-like [Ochotona curzoniae]|uniref:embryonic testis differentiation protein homolog B-like n=1 Tax=Ochotona curzoniae TaxID=130825 RepID=UPI001B34D5D5|nr:embryonic testis differentiation protein homolog B-like [Ochotona curzoniae]
MDKGQSKSCPSEFPVKGTEKVSNQQLKRHRTSNNILSYLISRQIGISRNDVDLSQWEWMLMCETIWCGQPYDNMRLCYLEQ